MLGVRLKVQDGGVGLGGGLGVQVEGMSRPGCILGMQRCGSSGEVQA